jgi:hypothetical protein
MIEAAFASLLALPLTIVVLFCRRLWRDLRSPDASR